MNAVPLDELAALLITLGCPTDKARAMAEQLDRRAAQLASHKGRSHAEALAHLLGLMQQGWAAQGRPGTDPPSAPQIPGDAVAE